MSASFANGYDVTNLGTSIPSLSSGSSTLSGSSDDFYGGSMSSDYVSGASGSGMTGGSHALTQSILGAISLASENVPLGASPVSLATPYPSAPITAPTPVTALGSSSLTTWLVVIVVIVIGLFAFKKL